jgi:hypothetical protein
MQVWRLKEILRCTPVKGREPDTGVGREICQTKTSKGKGREEHMSESCVEGTLFV